MKNSRLPSLPAIGEGNSATTSQPSARTPAAMSAQTASCTAASRTIPFLMWRLPASNCGLISATSSARGAASASAAGKTSLSEMKLTSTVTMSGGGSRV
jgi:hypothetical protein